MLKYNFDISYEDTSVITRLMASRREITIEVVNIGPAGGNPNINITCHRADRLMVEAIIKYGADPLMSEDELFTVEEI